jgi:hypothetical protein
MSELRGIEGAVNALRNRLEADLPAAITTINAAVTDGYTIDNPVEVLDHVPPLSTRVNFPFVAVEDGYGEFLVDNGFFAEGQYRISVLAFLQESTQQALARKLRRYQLALLRVSMQNRNLGSGTGIPFSVQLERTDPGPTLGEREDPTQWLSWVAVTLKVKLIEE